MTNISNREEFQKLINKYVQGIATAEEINFLEEYYTQFDDKSKGLSHLSDLQKKELKDEMRGVIHRSITKDNTIQRKLNIFKIAAAVTVLILSTLFLLRGPSSEDIVGIEETTVSNDLVYVETTSAEKHIYLSDGSYVLLSPGSSLTYIENFDSNIREIELVGEAFFDIYRDTLRPFIVHSNGVETEVLGTAFSISSYSKTDSFRLVVSHGKVQVSADEVSLGILEKQDEMILNRANGEVLRRKIEDEKIAHIEPEEFVMDDMEIAKAIDIIAKRWDCWVELESQALGQCRFTTSFMRGDSLEEIMAVISGVVGAEYRIEGNVVYLKGNGCN
ncbi:FecR family protein [Membranihabitans marinus]|uniref:FecR family protein n=1 Tax=Membranihabitans marinus TaxID=1227546 RepID=UPI001F354B45|nr:FecR domain-containing protein [Membranihabitans marinus]